MTELPLINLDANATFGLSPAVVHGLHAYIDKIQSGELLNPSSVHTSGQNAKSQLDGARESLLKVLGSKNYEVCFTSGATESNNLALNLNPSEPNKKLKVVTTAIEHPCILETAEKLEKSGHQVKYWRPSNGIWEILQLKEIIESDTDLVSVMYANNETGEIFPINEIVELVKEMAPSAIVHTDAAQAIGKNLLSLDNLKVDCLTISGHKFGALPGIGALVYRKGIRFNPILNGGPQEKRLRAGTENILGIISLRLACEDLIINQQERRSKMLENSQYLIDKLQNKLSGLSLFKGNLPRLPNTLSLRIDGVLAEDLVLAADLRGILISTGAACSSGKQLPSHVLLAHGYSISEAKQVIRLSLRGVETIEELNFASDVLVDIIQRMRGNHA